ncbi:beta-caryophyllene synthase [Tanacetum coccineum]|uniref:Beta-caryophyllene synthase n=1 Tax=Tanacetum coccineum TaxID=301880 RepID=A0ABQ4YLB0_9ASTR
MQRGFLSQKEGRGGRGVKDKQHSSAKDTTQVTGEMPSVADGPVLSRSCGHTVDENVGQTPTNSTDDLNKGGNRVNVVVPVESIRAISDQFANTTYGFFLGKHVAYLVVANYVRNTWGKYGLVESMLNSSTRIFSFQFSSMEGLDAMLENEDVSNIPVWVKIHGVSVTTFSEDGLSSISTNLGTPLMLEFYTSDMCIQSWGRSSYAKALIEVQAKGEEHGFDSKGDEVVPKVEEVSLVDGVFDGALGGDGNEDFEIGERGDWMMKLEWKPWRKKKINVMKMMKRRRRWNVDDVIFRRDLFDGDVSFLDIVLKEMVTNFDVLRPRVFTGFLLSLFESWKQTYRLLCFVLISLKKLIALVIQIVKFSVLKPFMNKTDEELTEKEVKQMEADDQAIQIILMGLLEDIYAAVDSCETA